MRNGVQGKLDRALALYLIAPHVTARRLVGKLELGQREPVFPVQVYDLDPPADGHILFIFRVHIAIKQVGGDPEPVAVPPVAVF